jgi:hypothetical protein
MQKFLSQDAILCRHNDFWANGLRKVLVEHLLPVGLVTTKEYIAELGKAGHVIQVQFFRCVDELRDHFINS